jgi:hypothetical protein
VLRELRRDILTLGDYWEAGDEAHRHRIEIAGAFLARACELGVPGTPTLAAGHASAGFLHGLPLIRDFRAELRALTRNDELLPWERRPFRIHLISADREHRDFRAGVEICPAALPTSHVVISGGVPVTSLARTAVDLMRAGTFDDAVAVADAALHLGAERSDLESVAEFCRRWPGSRTARTALSFADGRSESPAESVCRVRLAEWGYRPELQVDLFDTEGLIGRVDLFLRAFRIVIEVDGWVKVLDPWAGSAREALRLREARERRLRDAGWFVIRTTWHELRYEPSVFLARLEAVVAGGIAA